MATINDLYLKYVDGVQKNIEDDRYFQYLYTMIDAGEKEISQQRQVLHKVVDERWLEVIEEALDPLNRIIEKPRRFIERVEEVVPVALAKKITADSVMHLSMNTQFIASADEDEVNPTHILNVSLDESYDLYENRFIYHLIQRLVTFVDKRTDVIFWSTGDETQNTIQLLSHVDDAYERIDYKLEMTVKNLQSFAEKDQDNLEVFKRIDRVRRLVMALRASSFCEIMAGCQKVKSPIQRTNLLTKDPDYKVCYKLWQFLESYDEIGYTIEVQNSALEFDEEYIIQMYNNIISNYTVFKSITEADRRDVEGVDIHRSRTIKPRFNKEIVEEIVTDYNIPEVEVKQVIVEEVTQGQLDAEARLEAEIKAREEVEQALRDAEAGAHHSMIQADYAMSAKAEAEAIAKDAEERLREANEKLEEEREERDKLYLQIQEKDEIIAAKDEQIDADVKEYAKQLEEQRKDYEATIVEMSNKHELEIKEIFNDYKDKAEDIEMTYIDKMDNLEEQFAIEIETIQTKNEETLSGSIAAYEKQLEKQTADFNARLADERNNYQDSMDKQLAEFQTNIRNTSEKYEAELKTTRQDYETQLSEQDKAHTEELESIKSAAADKLARHKETAEAQLAAEISSSKKKYDELVKKTDDEYKALELKTKQEIADVKSDAKYQLIQGKEETDRRIAESQAEADRKCAEMKQQATDEILSVKKSTREELAAQSRAATEKTAELNAIIARLEQEKLELANSEKSLKTELKKESDARRSAETKAAADHALAEALEKKVTATTVSEFISALRAEKKAKKQAEKAEKQARADQTDKADKK